MKSHRYIFQRQRNLVRNFLGSLLLTGSLLGANSFTPTGGNVVSGYWNASNTGATILVNVPNNGSINYASAQLKVGANSWVGIGSPINVAAFINSEATLNYTASEIESATGFTNGETFDSRVIFLNSSFAPTGDEVTLTPTTTIDQTVPSISNVEFGTTSGLLKVGNSLTMTITSTETSLSASVLTINSIDVSETFTDNADNTYTATYTVGEGETNILDSEHIPISITLDDAAGNSTGSYTTSPDAGSSPGIDATTPTISSVTFSPTSGMLKVDDDLTMTITSTETGLTASVLTINNRDVSSTFTDNSDNTYTATYTVIEGDGYVSDAAQIAIGITLNDAATNTTGNYTTSPAAGSSPGIDANIPSILSVAYSPTTDTLKVGDDLTLTVTASETGLSASSVTVNSQSIGSTKVDNGDNTYTFTYTIGEGQTNITDASQIPLSVTMADAAGNSTGAYTTAPVAGSTPAIDANSPSITSVTLVPTSGTRKVGETINISINTGEAGLSLQALTFNNIDISDTHSDDGGGLYSATYEVVEGHDDISDAATIPIAIKYNDSAGNTTGNYTTPVSAESSPGIDAHSPSISSVIFSPTAGTLKVGDVLGATINASESGLTISTATINSIDVSENITDNGNNTYTALYTVAEGNDDVLDAAQIAIAFEFADTAGNTTGSFTTSPGAGSTPAIDANSPSISSVSFSPTSGSRKVGEAVTMTIVSTETGLSASAITMNGVDVTGTLSDIGGDSYTVTYTVAEGNEDISDASTLPISVTLQDAAGNTTNTFTTSPASGVTPSIDAHSPSITSVGFSPPSGTLKVAQNLTVTINASEASLTASTLTINGVDVSGTFTDNTGGVYSATYTVAEGDTDRTDSDQIPIAVELTDAAGNTTGSYTTAPASTATPAIDANSPSISSVSFNPSSGTLKVDDSMTMTINASEAGLSASTLTVNGVNVALTLVDNGGGSYSSTYTVEEGDTDRADSEQISIEVIFADAAGNVTNDFVTSPVAGSTPAIDANTPSITNISFSPTSGLLKVGDDLTVTITTGESGLTLSSLTINTVDVSGTIVDNSDGTYTATYTVVEENIDRSDTAQIPISIAFTDAAGNSTGTYTTSPAADDSPGIDANSPSITNATFNPPSGTLIVGDVLTVVVTASEAGLSANTITVNGVDNTTNITDSGGGTYSIAYTISEGDNDINDSSTIPLSIILEDAAGNTTNTYSTSPGATSTPIIDANSPVVSLITFSPTTGTLGIGDTLSVSIVASEAGFTPDTLKINQRSVISTFSDAGSGNYTAKYIVVAGDDDVTNSETVPVYIVLADAAGNKNSAFTTTPSSATTPAIDANRPTISNVSFSPTTGTLVPGDVLTATITASEAGLTAGAITINTVDVASTLADNGAGNYTLTYTVTEGDDDIADAATIPISIVLNDAAGNATTVYTTSPVAGSSPAIDANSPSITSVAFSPTSGLLKVGQTLTANIVASEAGLAANAMTINGQDVSALSNVSGTSYTVTYTVTEGDNDITDAATIPISFVLEDAAGNVTNTYTTSPAAGSSPAIDANSPVIISVAYSPTVGTLIIGDTLTLTINSTETGLTRQTISVNGKTLTNFTDNADNTYTVKYGVASGDTDIDDSATVPLSIVLKDVAGNLSSTYSAAPAATITPAIDANRPVISSVSFSPTADTLAIGDQLAVTINAGETDLVAGAITINSVDVASTLVDNGDNSYALTYTVSEGDNAIADNAQIPISIVFTDAAGNSNTAYTTSPAVTSSPAIDPVRPTVSSVSFSPTSGVLVPGESITMTITASENGLTATAITVNGVDVASSFSANGGGIYTVTYTISEGDDNVSDAATIPVSVQLQDGAGNTSAAYTTSPGAGNTPGIDANLPSVLAAVFNPTSGTLKIADTLTVNITAGEAGLTGSSITVNGQSVISTLTDLGGGSYRVKYGVVAGDTDIAQNSTIPISITLVDSAGNVSNTFTTSPGATSTPAIDANRPVISGVTFSPTSGSLAIGDTLTVTVTTGESGLTAGAITVNTVDVASTLTDNSDNTYSLTYIVSEGDNAIADNAQIPISIVLLDGAGNSSTTYTTSPAAENAPGIDPTRPTITNVTFSPKTGILTPGETLTMTLTASEAGLTATAISINGTSVTDNFTSTGGGTYTVTYQVAAGDDDVSDAATIPINVELEDGSGNTSAVYTTSPTAENSPGIDANVPVVLTATFSPTSGTLKIGDSLTVNITADEADYTASTITINGRSVSTSLTDLGAGSYQAKYGVTSGDTDIAPNETIPISITLADSAANLSTEFTNTPGSASAPAIDAHVPTISTVAFQPTTGTLGIGDSLTITITAGETGLTAGDVTINGVDVSSTLVDESDNSYTLTYVVSEGDNAIADNAQMPVSIVLQDAAGNNSATFTTSPPAVNTPAVDSARPTISSVSFSPESGVLVPDETITMTINAGEDGLTATAISVNQVAVEANFTSDGPGIYLVDYTITEGDDDVSDAATIPISIQLEDTAGNTSDVYTTSPAAENSPGIDANPPVVLTATFSPTSGTLKIGDSLTVNITADETQYESTAIIVNGRDISATLADLGSGSYRAKYGVTNGDSDIAQSATIPISISLADSAGNVSNTYSTTPSATSAPAIDATRPVISSVNFTPQTGSLGIGDSLVVTVNTQETGLSAGTLTVNGVDVSATLVDENDNSYKLTYHVSEGDNAVTDDAQIPISFTLIDDAGNSSATFTTSPAATSSPAIDPTAPTVNTVSFTPITGILVPGEALTATITASESGLSAAAITINGVSVDTTFSATGGGIYTVNYTVSEGDNDISDAAGIPISVQLSDGSGNVSNVYTTSPAAENSPGIDANSPVISSLYFTPQSGTLVVGDSLSITVTANEPRLDLNSATANGVTITTLTDNDDNSYTLKYGIGEEDNDILAAETLPLSIQFADSAGNVSNVYTTSPSAAFTPTIDANSPTITAISTATADGYRKVGDTVDIRLHFSESVVLSGGSLAIHLNSGATLSLPAFTADTAKTITYTVQAGDESDLLTVDSITLAAGTFSDVAGNATGLSLPNGANLADGSSIQVDGIVPADFVTGIVTPVGAPVVAGYWNSANTSLTVRVPVVNDASLLNGTIQLLGSAGDTWDNLGDASTITTINTTTDISVSAAQFEGLPGFTEGADILFNAVITDVAGNSTTGDTSATVLHVDQAVPTVAEIITTNADGNYGQNATIAIQVIFTEPVTLTGGALRLTLETGDTDAQLTNNAITNEDTIAFVYTVANGHISGDLTTSLLDLTAGTLQDEAGNEVDLALPVGNNLADNADLVIDGIGPTVAGITSTSADGWKKLNDAVNVTVTFNEPLTLSNGDTLQAFLNTGQRLDYLTISDAQNVAATYTVATDDTTYLLTVDSLVLSGGTLVDAGGNSVDLTIPDGQNLSDNNTIRVDGMVPVPFTSGAVVIEGPNTAAGYFNGTDTAVVVTITPDIDDESMVGGVAIFQGRIGTAVDFTTIGSPITLTDRNPRQASFTASQISVLPRYASGRMLRFRTILRDLAGNQTIGEVSADSVMIDITAPTGFSIADLTVSGGNVVPQVWNSTNTDLTLDIPVADDSTLVGGLIQIQSRTGAGGSFTDLGSAVSIPTENTTQSVVLNAATLSGFSNDDTLYFRAQLDDRAGNQTLSGIFSESVVMDLEAPAAFTTGSVTITGGTVVTDYWNLTNTGLNASIPIDLGDASLQSGYAYLEMGAEAGTFEVIGDSVDITGEPNLSIEISATEFENLTDFADGNDISVRAVLSDRSYTTIGSASANTITIDLTAPVDSTVATLTPQGGTVVGNFWNATNTSLQVAVPFDAADVSMSQGGTIQLQARVNNLPYTDSSTPISIETPVSPVNASLSLADLEALSGFGSGVNLNVRALVTDVAGNATFYNASETILRVDTIPPADVALSVTPKGDGAVSGRWNTRTDSAIVRIPMENDSTLLHLNGQPASVGVALTEMRTGTEDWVTVGESALITSLDDSLRIAVARSEIITLTGYADSAWIYTRCRITDQAGNTTFSTTSEDSLLIDISPPGVFAIIEMTTTGGNVVENYWNGTNSGVEVAVPIADDASLMAGTLDIQVYVGGSWTFVDGEGIAATEAIEQINTTQVVQIDSSVIEHLEGFDEFATLWFNAIITDRNGNRTLSSPVTHYLAVDQTAPDTVEIAFIDNPDAIIPETPYPEHWNSLMTGLVFNIDIPSDDPSLLGGSVQMRMRTGGNPFANFQIPDTIQSSGILGLEYDESQMESIAGFTDGRYLDATFILTDVAGNSTPGEISNDILYIDQTIPVAGNFIPERTSLDGYMNAADTLKAAWENFTDAHSGLQKYRYAVGTAPKLSDVNGWVNLEPEGATFVNDSLASLVNATTYFLSVVAFDSAGNSSDTISTNGIYYDDQVPVTLPQMEAFYFIEDWVDGTTVNGTAFDADAGLDSVFVQITRLSDSTYWDGFGWQNDSIWNEVTNLSGGNWTFPLPVDTLTNRVDYRVSSRAVDLAQNSSLIAETDFQFVINTPPSLAAAIPDTTAEDTLYTYRPSASDPDIGTISGDTLTYYLLTGPGAMNLDSLTGFIQWTPANADTGDTLITIRVADTHDEADTTSFVLTVLNVNDPPEPVALVEPADSTVLTPADGLDLTFRWTTAADIDNTELSYLLQFESQDYDTTILTTDTTITVDVSVMDFPVDTSVIWYVQALDHVDSSIVAEQFRLTGSPPIASLEYDTLSLRIKRYTVRDTTLGISNGGLTNLRWNAVTTPGWLSTAVENGTVGFENTQNLALHLGTDTLAVGRYTGTITIATNDPQQDSLDIFVDVTILDKPELALALYQNQVYPRRYEIMVVDSLGMVDSLALKYGTTLLSTERPSAQVYIGNINVETQGNKTLTAQAFSWAGDTTITRNFTVTLTKPGENWLAISDDGRLRVKGVSNALSGSEVVGIVDSSLILNKAAPYAILGRKNAIRQPLLVTLQDTATNRAIYQEVSEGQFVELPTLYRDGQLMAWTENFGALTLGKRTMQIPETTLLSQNYPNPFNPETQIAFDLGFMDGLYQQVDIRIYNILGQEVRKVAARTLTPGHYELTWNGLNNSGQQVSSGIYFTRIMTDAGYSKSIKMVLLR